MKQNRGTVIASLALTLAGASACGDSSSGLAAALTGSGSSPSTALDVLCVGAPAAGPVVTPSVLSIWPPNHKFHSFSVADCVRIDSCAPTVSAEFIWGSSDEPVDDIGDGHFAPDILFDDCGHVELRSERQGPKDGRVYKLGVRVVDSAGNVAESTCTVVVDHDQRGVLGADSGESYRVTPTQPSGLVCDGTPEVPPPVVPPAPPAPPVPVDAGTPPITIGI